MPYVTENCSNCVSGNKACYLCGGARQTTCTSCGGSGSHGWGENSKACFSCGSSGRTTCIVCGGSGSTSCSTCNGNGYTKKWVQEKGTNSQQPNNVNTDGCATIVLMLITIPTVFSYVIYQIIST